VEINQIESPNIDTHYDSLNPVDRNAIFLDTSTLSSHESRFNTLDPNPMTHG
jgi:hypothetical protein